MTVWRIHRSLSSIILDYLCQLCVYTSEMTSTVRQTVKPLRVNDLLFINEYLANGRNGTHAYMKIHPHAKPDSARANAPLILAKACVQRALAERLQQKGWDKTQAIDAVLSIRDRASGKGALDTELRAVAELNDLAGLHVQKHEDVTPAMPASPAQLTEALRARGFVPVAIN